MFRYFLQYAFETSKQFWDYLMHTKESNDLPSTASDYAPPSPPTQMPPTMEPSPSSPNEPNLGPSSSNAECPKGSGIQLRELNERLNQLKKNLEENFAMKWQIYEDKVKALQ